MALPNPSSYNPGRVRPITDEKMANMVQMYNNFVPLNRRPAFLPVYVANTKTQGVRSVSSSSNAAGTSSISTSVRKKYKCSIQGCDGTGHKNPVRWSEGHTSKSGCPRKTFVNC